MSPACSTGSELVCRSLTPERWDDLEALFGPERGAQGGCWCMWFRLIRREFDAAGKDGRKRQFRARVESGPPPGLLGYLGDDPVAWVAVAPRADQPVVERSRVTRPVDGTLAWAITCFYVRNGYRRAGLMRPLIEAATGFAREGGAPCVEAYPFDVAEREPFGGYHGFAGAFRDLGFTEIARRSAKRPIMRLEPR